MLLPCLFCLCHFDASALLSDALRPACRPPTGTPTPRRCGIEGHSRPACPGQNICVPSKPRSLDEVASGREPVRENAAASAMWRTHAPGGCCGISAAEDAGAHIVLAEPRSLDEAASGRAPRQGGTGTSSDPRGCGERVGVGLGEDAGTHHDTHYPLR